MNTFLSMLPGSLMVAAPIIICALGGLLSERSGITNIALEGIMTVGAFVSAALLFYLEKVPGFGSGLGCWVAVLAGAFGGMLFSTLLAIAAIRYKSDQTIAGAALNMLSVALCIYISQILFGHQRTDTFTTGITRIKKVPLLGDIPIIGPLLFQGINPTIYVAVVLVVIVWFVVFKTRFGLRLRSCGENPQASASLGVKVEKIRTIAVLASGFLGGMAGALMVLTTDTQFTASSIHGMGFISLAALIFGKWQPFGALGAGIFFGFAQQLGVYANMIPLLNQLPSEFFHAIPYVITIIALVLFSSKAVGPRAAGQIYDPGQR
ncbi:MAG: ABC transporter permease [Erysipelotrichaceae bacterium]|jgi:simple sugar transport system permease protein|nr:ABC transporter permease [Erysipelotrichaceae bacterium]